MPATVTETRTREELRQHYEVERELAERLRKATKEECRSLHFEVYDEPSRRVPRHLRELPANLRIVISEGSSIPVPPDSVDVAYSNQLMEQLHAAPEPGGVYQCITPSRLTGPHNISGEFDREATRFHLKDYTVGDLAALFRGAGCARMRRTVALKPPFRRLLGVRLVGFQD